ncbi:hypothetical protein MTES_0961 [Microbacterium testaceum StLB037]|uniref:Uncharacterized protein n=1 Tax=Microbacterium testaceum (strain StLB037) TaxID=979556 RepID=E8NF71_MICTS|nr:hypothetical protein [Microbacterium testaceum]BAJ73925.1 hypothetical protein MTES_0961 [Microbacterium testaceum StLB037]
MSGPYDKPDDPEDVTLWAGRLRPWPASVTPATADDGADPAVNEDETLIARRGTARRAEVANEEAVADDTAIVARESQDHTVLVRRGATTNGPEADEVGDTAPAEPARRAGTVPDMRAADDDTAPGRRGPNDETVRSPRARERAEDVSADRTPRTRGPEGGPEPTLDDTTTAARRTSGLAEPLPATAPGRRRAGGVLPDLGAGVDVPPREEPRVRTARVPGAEVREAYGPRGDDAIRVRRNEPVPRADSALDTASVRPKKPHRGVAGPLIIGGTTVVVLAGALAAFVLLVR